MHTSNTPQPTSLHYQVNARPAPGLQMRVGIPHRGGRLAVHAFNQGYPVMVSANAFWHARSRSFRFPDATDLTETDFAMDSAGFTAIHLFQRKGRQDGMAGIFPWSCRQYIEFANLSGATWWSQPDLCCEPEVAGDQDAITYRVNATATLLEECLQVLYAWQNQMVREGWSSNAIVHALRPPVPVLQGYSVSDYLESLELLLQVWERWTPWLAMPALIGLGSVCRRDLTHPRHGLFSILTGLEGRLPAGARLHLYGVKGTCLDQIKMLDWVASADSMAFDYGARRAAFKNGQSNSLAHRCEAMSQWMRKANAKMQPTPGDQFRLPLASAR